MDVGGVERSITRLLNGLPTDRYRCTVVCMDRSGKAMEWVENPEIQVIELSKKPGWDFRAMRQLAEVIRVENIDILQSHNWGTLFECVRANRARRAKHIHAERGTVLGPPSKSRIKTALKAWMMRYALKHVDRLMSNSFATAEKVRRTTGLKGLPITVIPNGVENPYSETPFEDPRWDAIRDATRKELGVRSNDLLVGVVGRLSPVKNFELAVQGFARFLKDSDENRPRSADLQIGRATLILVGDGPRRRTLESLAEELGVRDRVQFLGEKKDAWPYYAAMDIFLSTSHSEGMSQSILEAMASGKAIISTDVGDASTMLDYGRSGRILAQPSAKELADRLSELTNESIRLILGKLSHQQYCNRYSLYTMLDAFNHLYQDLNPFGQKGARQES